MPQQRPLVYLTLDEARKSRETKAHPRAYRPRPEGKGADFVQHYSYLPNVLKRMDELVEAGLTWQYPHKGILSGTLDARFRGLIISKLCNDPNFERKIAWCDERFYDGTNDNWLPYYEKLKAEVLPTIEPKYNL